MTITVSDGNGGSDDLTVTITVTDAFEPPLAPAAPTVNATAGSTTSLSVSWTAPDNTGRPVIDSYDLQYVQGSGSIDTGALIRNVTGSSRDITSLTAGTSYQVRVRAVNDEGDGEWSNAATGTTNTAANNAPTVANPIPDVEATAGVPLSYTFGAGRTRSTTTAATVTRRPMQPTYSQRREPADLADVHGDDARVQRHRGSGLHHEPRSGHVHSVPGDRHRDGQRRLGHRYVDQLTVNRAPTRDSAPANQTAARIRRELGTRIAAPHAASWTPRPAARRPFTSLCAVRDVPATGLTFNPDVQGAHRRHEPAPGRPRPSGDLRYRTGHAHLHRRSPATDDNGAIARDTFMITVNTPANRPPAFPSATATRSIAENSAAGTNVGGPLPAATDPDGDTVTYTLGGTNASSFVFNATTRQLTVGTGTNLNHESQSTYTVTLTASDGSASAVADRHDQGHRRGRAALDARRADGQHGVGLGLGSEGYVERALQHRQAAHHELRPAIQADDD